MIRLLSALIILGQSRAAPSSIDATTDPAQRSMLFSSIPGGSPSPSAQTCNATYPTFLPTSIAEKNTVFDQLTVTEQVAIQAWMKEKYGIITDAYAKCADVSCHTIAKMALIKPPKAEVMAWMAGTGPKPPRVAQFWYRKV